MSAEIRNAKITDVTISMTDHGCLTFYLTLEGAGWCVNYGGYVIGFGYLGASNFSGSGKGVEAMMRIMDVVGVDRWEALSGQYVRVQVENLFDPVETIGNILEDRWFNIREFFKAKEDICPHCGAVMDGGQDGCLNTLT